VDFGPRGILRQTVAGAVSSVAGSPGAPVVAPIHPPSDTRGAKHLSPGYREEQTISWHDPSPLSWRDWLLVLVCAIPALMLMVWR
jgi:hypothetical protein